MLPSFAMTVITPLSTENLTTSFIGSQKTVPSFILMTRRIEARASAGLAGGIVASGARSFTLAFLPAALAFPPAVSTAGFLGAGLGFFAGGVAVFGLAVVPLADAGI